MEGEVVYHEGSTHVAYHSFKASRSLHQWKCNTGTRLRSGLTTPPRSMVSMTSCITPLWLSMATRTRLLAILGGQNVFTGCV